MIKKQLSKHHARLFWKKVCKTEGCWEWTAALNEKGYGVFGVGKETDKAHRISYRLCKGEIPQKLFVLHKCDNPKCVNPEHLWVGTNHDNVLDMTKKGRNSPPPNMGGWNRIKIPKDLLPLIGKIADTQIAKNIGCSKYAVQKYRKRMGIKAFPCQTLFKRKEVMNACGKESDSSPTGTSN